MKVSVPNTTRLDLLLLKTGKLSIDPNPASDFIDISSDFQIYSITLTDLFGKNKLSLDNIWDKKVRIDLSDWRNGMYVVVVQTARVQVARKVVVLH